MLPDGDRALENLVCWRGELAELVEAARLQEGRAVVVLDRGRAAAALQKVIDGTAAPDHLTAWAQAVHFSEHLELEEGHEDLLARFLVEVSTPELFEPVTPDVCRAWLATVRTAQPVPPADR